MPVASVAEPQNFMRDNANAAGTEMSMVMVTTKIVESGIDIPSVNTIVINRADKFGLAELYQLRGRVGRSNIQAYCFMIVPPPAAATRHQPTGTPKD